MKWNRHKTMLLAGALALMLVGCGQAQTADETTEETLATVEIAEEAVPEADGLAAESAALSQAEAAIPMTISAVPSGELVKQAGGAIIDYSNTKDGYVMAKYTQDTNKRLKVQVKGPATTYTYNLTPGQWASFPLTDGNGEYKVIVFQNVEGTKYAAVNSLTTAVTLTDEFAPYLHSNQYVDYDCAPNTVAKAVELTKELTEPLEKVEAIYNYVVETLTYDKELAATVKSGYLPVLDEVLEREKGICFDYGALMAGMLRSQGIPCKLVVGYAGTAYHAWINVWVEGSGWVDGVIWFDGTTWQRMDPTFASTGNSSAAIMAYIGDGSHYSAKYFY